MGLQLEQLALEKGGQAIDSVMGIALGGIQDKRQLRQQKKLQALQIAGNKELTDYQMQKQLQMWKDTSYEAQVEQMEKAGINPALMYGMSGGGGQTTGSATGLVQGASAPVGGKEAETMAAMGIQRGLMEAQKRVMETQADKNEAEANKTKGVDTTEAQTRIQSITQGIENQKAIRALTIAQDKIANIQFQIGEQTMDDIKKKIHAETNSAIDNARIAMNEANISTETQQSKITILKQDAINKFLEGELMQAQKGQIASNISLNKDQMKKWAEEIAQGWEGLSIRLKEAKVKAIMDEVEQTYKGTKTVWRIHDAREIAAQIDDIMEIGREDFKKNK